MFFYFLLWTSVFFFFFFFFFFPSWTNSRFFFNTFLAILAWFNGIRVVSPRKVSRFAPLNRYYIIKDEVFFDYFLEIIYLLVVCKKYNNSFILVYFKYLFISCTYKKKQPFYCSCVVFCKFCKKSFTRDL